jgi:uroporphyrinogen decarboxylase
MALTAKQNALEIIRFGRPERVMGGPPCYTLAYLGANHEGFDGRGHEQPVGSKWTDIWGTGWHREHEGVMGFPKVNPISEPARLRGYRWPNPNDERIIGRIYTMYERFKAGAAGQAGEVFLCGSHRDTIWEKAYMLVGMEDLMMYFHIDRDFAREVCHRIMDWQMGIAQHYIKLGVEMISCTDDLGTQSGPLLGPGIVHEFLVPEYRRLFSLYRQHGVLINFHCCGQLDTVLAPLMDLGVNILNPVQATANDLDKVRAATAM